MAERITPFIQPAGTPDFPRIVVTEPGGRVWTGSVWSADSSQALLFARPVEAARACQTILREQYREQQVVRQFSAPLRIEVHSDTPVPAAVLRAWLRQAVDLQVSYRAFGNGPTPESLALLSIDWSYLRPS